MFSPAVDIQLVSYARFTYSISSPCIVGEESQIFFSNFLMPAKRGSPVMHPAAVSVISVPCVSLLYFPFRHAASLHIKTVRHTFSALYLPDLQAWLRHPYGICPTVAIKMQAVPAFPARMSGKPAKGAVNRLPFRHPFFQFLYIHFRPVRKHRRCVFIIREIMLLRLDFQSCHHVKLPEPKV